MITFILCKIVCVATLKVDTNGESAESPNTRCEMQRLIRIIIIACILLTSILVFAAPEKKNEPENGVIMLSEFEGLSSDESLELLLENGLILPDAYKKDPELAKESVNAIIRGMMQSGKKTNAFSYTELIALEDRISDIVEIDQKYMK